MSHFIPGSASRVAVAVAIALVLAPAAAARDVTGGEFRALVLRAADDPAALASLRDVDSVDGRPVDLERALAGASRPDLRLRLRALRARAGGAGRPADARRRADKILGERRFDETSPRPFRGLLEWLSAPVRKVSEALGRLVETLARPLPGGERTFWLLLSLLVCGAAALVATRMARRRTASAEQVRRRAGRREKLDPRGLEREAEEAERRGELERALRLRFRAGLMRLGLAEAIPLRDSVTSGEVRRRLQRPEFDALAAAFDEIVYGGRKPERSDVEQARTGWPLLLKAVEAT